MPNSFSFSLITTRGLARAGSITTPHGQIKTPIFMPVGTRASVRSLDSLDLEQLEAQIILGNTYHLYLKPGTKIIEAAGGLHQFMRWDHPMLTDSGGYQVFSLGEQQRAKGLASTVKISEEGVIFTSHLDGSKHVMTPETSIQIQQSLGADIIMVFDECLPDSSSDKMMNDSVERTTRWAQRCKIEWESANKKSLYGKYQALFGIVQGSTSLVLREKSLRSLLEIGFDGYALGGETVGYDLTGTQHVMASIGKLLPEQAPRYAMGMGRDPQDVIEAILMGFDMFDCVGPTRLARNGAIFVGHLDTTTKTPVFKSDFPKGRLAISNQRFANDHAVLQADCDCSTCRGGYTRAYLHHLYNVAELSFYRLASIHNLRVMVRLATEMRDWIVQST